MRELVYTPGSTFIERKRKETRLGSQNPIGLQYSPLNKKSSKRISASELLWDNWRDWRIHVLHATLQVTYWQLQQGESREGESAQK